MFATRDLEPGKLFERCPIIVIPPDDLEMIVKTVMRDYYYDWGDDLDAGGVALGFGSFYNHSFDPNAVHEKHFSEMRVDLVARRLIRRGEEITINYNGTYPTDNTPLKVEWVPNVL